MGLSAWPATGTKRHRIAAAVRKAGHGIDDDTLDALLARLVRDRLLLHHDDFLLFPARDLPQGRMRSGEIARQVLAELG